VPQTMFSLKDKVAVVTGASRGIGRHTALALAEAGAKVAVAARTEEKLAALVNEIAAAGGGAFAVKMDVADAEQVKAGFKQVLEKFGRLDILVNNAAITRDGLAMRMKADDWDAVIRTNLTGAHLCIQQALPTMMKARAGRIINIASVVAQMGNAGQSNYVAAKAGLIGLTKAIAIEISSRNITVNAVAPGFIETPHYLHAGTQEICSGLHLLFSRRARGVFGPHRGFSEFRKNRRRHAAGRQGCRSAAPQDQWILGLDPSPYDTSGSSRLDLLLTRFATLGSHKLMLEARRGAWWDANKIGMSPPPIETSRGWLMIYHGVRRTPSSSIYRLGLALFDLEQPAKCLIRGIPGYLRPRQNTSVMEMSKTSYFLAATPWPRTGTRSISITALPIQVSLWRTAAFALF